MQSHRNPTRDIGGKWHGMGQRVSLLLDVTKVHGQGVAWEVVTWGLSRSAPNFRYPRSRIFIEKDAREVANPGHLQIATSRLISHLRIGGAPDDKPVSKPRSLIWCHGMIGESYHLAWDFWGKRTLRVE